MTDREYNDRGDKMAACSAAMPSYTYAVKAERLLRSKGFSCSIARNENISENGCGYLLYISGSCPKALELLSTFSIPYTSVTDGGV